jgi:hypothetical protein
MRPVIAVPMAGWITHHRHWYAKHSDCIQSLRWEIGEKARDGGEASEEEGIFGVENVDGFKISVASLLQLARTP